MSYELVIVEPAEFDVDYIYRYISRRSPPGASSWYRALEKCRARIVDQPYACSLAHENPRFPFELRQAIARRHLNRRSQKTRVPWADFTLSSTEIVWRIQNGSRTCSLGHALASDDAR